MSRIFVVEDEVIVCDDIAQTLEQLGYEVAGTAQTAMAALLAIDETRPDLVLMDIKLAGRLDGIQATAAIRKRWSIPVIYLTSHSDEATLARAKETGPHGYLLKPFSERDLRTAIEIALRKSELEKKLEQRERWFSATLASVGDAVIGTDAEERVTFMNAVAERITGWKKEEAYSKPLREVFSIVPQSDERTSSGPFTSRDGFRAELPAEAKLVGRDGGSKDVSDSIAPIVDGEGCVLGRVVVFRDITEKRRLEQRLVLAERLTSIASMATGMAHEINNPLAAAVGNVDFAVLRISELARQATSADSPQWLLDGLREASEALTDARAAGQRVRRIVSDLKRFSRAEEPALEALDLPDVLRAALDVTRHLAGSKTSLVTRLSTTPLIEANEGQLVQVFVNLIANAIQAGQDLPGHHVEISTSVDNLGRAVLEVRDSGHGIRAEDLTRVFDPFFTTKPSGSGLGLGLSVCQNVITALGGEISVESQLGAGATFRVVLRSAGDPERTRRATSMPPPSRRARVLVIDDEEIVGRMIERLVSKAHDVHRETDPQRALARIGRGEAFDVILCDLTMPTVNGVDIYETLSEVNPDLAKRIIFLTGGALSDRIQRFIETCPNLVLQKPFSVNQLLTAIASLAG